MAPRKKANHPDQSQVADSYEHKTADSPMRPDVGTQTQFKKRKPPKTYHYDTSLDPALSWDEGNGSRGLREWLLARIADAATLPAPHRFPVPQRFTGADGKALATVHGLEGTGRATRNRDRVYYAFGNSYDGSQPKKWR
jgi:adenine-specific DNA-methyltransferase